MIYRVTKQFSGGSEQPCQQFKTLDEARVYAADCASKNAALKIKVIYRVYEFDDVLVTLDSSKISTEAEGSSDAGAVGGKQSGANFRPTPLQTTMRPAGMPQNWSTPPDEDKSK